VHLTSAPEMTVPEAAVSRAEAGRDFRVHRFAAFFHGYPAAVRFNIVTRGDLIVSKMRMILIPLAVIAAIVVMAMTRRPGKLSRRQSKGR